MRPKQLNSIQNVKISLCKEGKNKGEIYSEVSDHNEDGIFQGGMGQKLISDLQVPNKRTGRLLENEKNPTYMPLFGTILLLIFSKKFHLYVYSLLYFQDFLSDKTNVSQIFHEF